ncbi:uncharacterized protein LOC127800661 [Diospyros lotus]|uniref:uncharacterized protein LOC127800661 n=1 Tax=Diospyros lotus TaxID=55363 RepID=UPI002258810E|nr:uncharacterized protein LOC127800661 [Diospyros lotus]
MDFDEYDYLEKTVEEEVDRDGSPSKKSEKTSKGYRRRKGSVDAEGDARDRRSKKSRGDEVNGDVRERSSRSERHRSSREGERERREKDKERERERREKEKEKEKERERERRERERPSGKHDGEREKEFVRDREQREHDSRDTRKFKDKKEAVEPEADPERDQRTVFAYQMPLKATERDVYEFFSKAGKVRDVRLIMDRNSRRSKGVGYVEFYDAMSVPMAIALSGQLLLGQPVMVKPSEAEKNLVQTNASLGGSVAGPYGAVDRKLYVGNLHFNMTDFQLKQIFEAFGPVELVQLPTDSETGHCKGFGFVQFAQLEHAKAAQSLNGKLEIAGRIIKVSSVTDHVGVQDSGVKGADLDDDEGGGLSLNAQSRALLMQKLYSSGVSTSATGSTAAPVLNGLASNQQPTLLPVNELSRISPPAFPALMTTVAPEPIGRPSECLLLKNMFDPATEVDQDFDLDIKEDVQEECSKYGRVKHICVDKNSSGYVYLRFDTVEAATGAQQAMHKRWFARRLISAVFLQPYEYDAKFKGAA